MPTDLSSFLEQYQKRCNDRLDRHLNHYAQYDTQLIEAMKYSLLNGGKRVRPILVYASSYATGAINEASDYFACAVEAIHAYSLIHDDLPSMDDDDLRRGKPTNHVVYGEATAILAGDALQCLAFELLAEAPNVSAEIKLNALRELSNAAGAKGMVMGQAIDLAAVNQTRSLTELETMHAHKTGALIEASVALGALASEASDSDIAHLRTYSKAVGLAFQVQDDILDVTADTETLGKAQGADASRNKPTYVSLLGLDAAKAKANELLQQSHDALSSFGDKASVLRELANYIVERKY